MVIKILKNYFYKRKSNYAFWLSLASAIILFLTKIGFAINNEIVIDIIKSILEILVVLGIVNDPTTKNNGYADDKNQW